MKKQTLLLLAGMISIVLLISCGSAKDLYYYKNSFLENRGLDTSSRNQLYYLNDKDIEVSTSKRRDTTVTKIKDGKVVIDDSTIISAKSWTVPALSKMKFHHASTVTHPDGQVQTTSIWTSYTEGNTEFLFRWNRLTKKQVKKEEHVGRFLLSRISGKVTDKGILYEKAFPTTTDCYLQVEQKVNKVVIEE